MKSIFFVIAFLIAGAYASLSQTNAPPISSIKSYGGSGYDGGDGGSSMPGFHFSADGYLLSASGSGSADHDLVTCNNSNPSKGWLVKIDKQGNLIHISCFGGSLQKDSVSESDEYFTDMVATPDSGCLAACYTTSANILPNAPFPYACANAGSNYKVMSLVKYDKSGNVQWFHCYGGGQDDGIMSLERTTDGGYIFLAQVRSFGGDVGMHYGNSPFVADAWLVKVDSIGDIQWKKVLGGTGYDYPHKVIEVKQGIYLTSITSNSTDYDLDSVAHYCAYDAWFCFFDSAGNRLNQFTVPWYGRTINAYDFIYNSDKSVILVGNVFGDSITNLQCNAYFHNDYTTCDYAIFKIDSNFQMKWCNIVGGPGFHMLYSVNTINDGLLLACGRSDASDSTWSCAVYNSQYQSSLICFDSNGATKWRRCISGSQGAYFGYSLFDTATQSIYLCGAGMSTDGDLTGVPNYGYSDLWIAKFDDVTGIARISDPSAISIYPNPSKTEINIAHPPYSDGIITLSNITGGIISTAKTNSNETETINIDPLPLGVYILTYQDRNICVSKKVVKE